MQLRPDFDDYFLPLIEQYEEEHPDVAIRWEDYPATNYETKLMMSFFAHSAPDVINLSSESVTSYIKNGTIQSIDDYIDSESRAAYVPRILSSAGVYKDRLWCLPWYAVPEVMFVNKQILEEAGMSMEDVPRYYDDLPEFCRQIRERTGKFGYYPIYTEGSRVQVLLWERGVPITSPDGKQAAFNTPEAEEVFTFWSDLYFEGLVPRNSITATHRTPIEQYKLGNLALLTAGPQLSRQFKNDAPEVYDATEVVELPRWSNSEKSLLALMTLAVSKESNHSKEAVDFAVFLTNEANQIEFAKRTITMPSVTKALQDPLFQNSDDSLRGRMFAVAARETAKGEVLRPIRNNAMLNEVLNDVMESTLLGRVTPKEALEEAERRINDVLGR